MLHDKGGKRKHSDTSSPCIKGPIMSGSGGGKLESSAIKDLHKGREDSSAAPSGSSMSL